MRVKLTKEQIKEPNNERQMVSCIGCGYQAELREFLVKDREDTTCPKCGADEVIYEL